MGVKAQNPRPKTLNTKPRQEVGFRGQGLHHQFPSTHLDPVDHELGKPNHGLILPSVQSSRTAWFVGEGRNVSL